MKAWLFTSLLMSTTLAQLSYAEEIKVNGIPISQARIDSMVDSMTEQAKEQGQKPSPQIQEAARDTVITSEILRQEAVRKGLDKTPQAQAELQNIEAITLANVLIKNYQHTVPPISEAEIERQYQELKAKTPPKILYHAQHILVASEKDAEAILLQLRKGKPFSQLAKEKSLDTVTQAKGGDLGWSDASHYVAPFATALTTLKKGQITPQPVKTEFGWHIIKLDDVRQEPFPSLAEARSTIEYKLKLKEINDYVQKTRKEAKVTGIETNKLSPALRAPSPASGRGE